MELESQQTQSRRRKKSLELLQLKKGISRVSSRKKSIESKERLHTSESVKEAIVYKNTFDSKTEESIQIRVVDTKQELPPKLMKSSSSFTVDEPQVVFSKTYQIPAAFVGPLDDPVVKVLPPPVPVIENKIELPEHCLWIKLLMGRGMKRSTNGLYAKLVIMKDGDVVLGKHVQAEYTGEVYVWNESFVHEMVEEESLDIARFSAKIVVKDQSKVNGDGFLGMLHLPIELLVSG